MNKLLSYLPPFLREYEELKRITDSEYPEVEYVNNGIRLVLSNQFVNTLSAEGCERWENILHINPLSDDTLVTRRRKILEKMNTTLPYTERSFQSKLDVMYGDGNVEVVINRDKYELWLEVSPLLMFKINEMKTFSRKIVPANLCIYTKNTKHVDVNFRFGGVVTFSKRAMVIPPKSILDGVNSAGTENIGGVVTMKNKETEV